MNRRVAGLTAIGFASLVVVMAFQNCGKGFELGEGAEAYRVEASRIPGFLLESAPGQIDNSRTANFRFTPTANKYSEIKSAACSVDADAPVDCTTGQFAVSGLADGSHTFTITITDAQNRSSTNSDFVWMLDATLPSITLSRGPAAFAPTRAALIDFSISEAGTGLQKTECSLNAGAFEACGTSVQLANLNEGPNKFRIRATDKATNAGLSEINWVVDVTAPVLVGNALPPAILAARNFSAEFTGTDAGSGIASFECAYDTTTFTACTSPLQLSNMADGPHRLMLKAFDRAGNMSLVRDVQWTVDATAPVIMASTTASPFTNQTTATFVFSGTDNGAAITQFRCSIDNGGFQPCTSPLSVSNFSEGGHTFDVTGLDSAGNMSSPTRLSFVVDLTAPFLVIDKFATPTTQQNATFVFNGMDFESGLMKTECSIGNGIFADCASPVSYFNLARGIIPFVVRATDRAGNTKTETVNLEIVNALQNITSINVNATFELKLFGNNLFTGSNSINIANRTVPVPYKYSLGSTAYSIDGTTLHEMGSGKNNYLRYSLANPDKPVQIGSNVILPNLKAGAADSTSMISGKGTILTGCFRYDSTFFDNMTIAIYNIPIGGAATLVTELTDTLVPVPTGDPKSVDIVTNCQMDGNILYVERTFSKTAYLITDTKIEFIARYPIYDTFGVTVENNIMVGTDNTFLRRNELDVFQIVNGKANLVSTIKLGWANNIPVTNLQISNGYLIVTKANQTAEEIPEFRVYDIRNPAAPKLLGIGQVPFIFSAVVAFPYVYTHSSGNDIGIFRIN